MYKAIIVDDEELVCKGLRKHFDWNSYDIDILADLPDGQKAFEFVQENPIDLLITDVRMPYMDGITLAKNVRELYPQTKVIFVSGYDDVAYLKKALKVEAVDYILKSIDLEELKETVSRVVQIMDTENKRKKSFEDMERLLNQSFPLLQERFLITLIKDEIENLDLIRDQIKFFNIPLNEDTCYCVLVLQVHENYSVINTMTERERQLRSLKIQTECSEVAVKYGKTICFKSRQHEYVLILSLQGEGYEETLLQVSEELQDRLKEGLDAGVSIGISDRYKGFKNIKNSYENASKAISKQYLLDNSLTISVDKYEVDEGLKEFKDKAEKKLIELLSHGSTEQVSQVLSELLDDVSSRSSEEDQQNLLIFLLLLPSRLITDVKVKKKSHYSNQKKILEQFLCCADFQEQCDLIQRLYTEVVMLMNSLSKTPSNALIDQVRKTIDERYMEQIDIGTLAEEAYLTPTYLCVLFKQVTGSTINEYLTLTRVEKAKKLLVDPRIKLYDICYKVGYLSPSYFSRLFKKYVGITPSEYRNMAIPSSEE